MNLDDLLDKFNWISRVQGYLWTLTSWWPTRRSHKGRHVGPRRLAPGVRQIEIDRRAHSGAEVERILARAHIPIAGRRVTGKAAIFLVRTRQAAWAEYILLRAGVTLAASHQIIDPRNARWAGQHTDPVALWGADRQRRGANGAKASAHTDKCRGSVTRSAIRTFTKR